MVLPPQPNVDALDPTVEHLDPMGDVVLQEALIEAPFIRPLRILFTHAVNRPKPVQAIPGTSLSLLTRAITVLKTRAAHHEPVAHRYEISNEGLVLGDEIAIER
jgi:hypothetical protein